MAGSNYLVNANLDGDCNCGELSHTLNTDLVLLAEMVAAHYIHDLALLLDEMKNVHGLALLLDEMKNVHDLA